MPRPADAQEHIENLMRERGFIKKNGSAHHRALARAMGVAPATVQRLIYGDGEPSPETVMAAVRELGPTITQWIGASEPNDLYVGPPESMYLDAQQRDAIDKLIRAMAKANTTGLTAS